MYPAQPDSPDFEVQVDVGSGDTDITFISLTGLLAAPNTLTIRQDDNDTTPETVYYATDPTGDTLTVTRGYGGTVAKDFTAGALACRAHTAYDHNTFRSNIGDIVSTISGLAVDTAVFHKATAGEINALMLKATPAASDVLMIEDSAGAAFDKKKIAISTLPFQAVLTNPVTGLATPFVSGDVITGTGTGNQVQDSGVLLSDLATKSQIPSAVSGDIITGTGTGIQDSGVLLSSLAPLSSPTFINVPAAPTAPNGTQTTQIATTAFVQNAISYLDPLLYKGTIDCSTNPNYPAADAGNLYIASVSGKIGGASGKAVLVGDMILCNHDATPSGDEAAVGIYWNAIQANMGAVIGPASSTDGHLVLFDGPSGKSVKDGGAVPTGNVVGPSSAVDGHIAAFDTTTGKLLKDGGAIPVVPAFETTATNIKMDGVQAVGSSGLIPNSDHIHPSDISRLANSGAANGKIYIGKADGTFALVNITQGANITITNADGAITIAAASGGVTFAGVSGTTQQAAVNNGYIPLNAALTTITLPATAAVGDVVAITGYGAGLWKLAQNASQLIQFLSLVTTTGTGGYIRATTRYDTIIVRCVVANTTWVVENAVGNLDVI